MAKLKICHFQDDNVILLKEERKDKFVLKLYIKHENEDWSFRHCHCLSICSILTHS